MEAAERQLQRVLGSALAAALAALAVVFDEISYLSFHLSGARQRAVHFSCKASATATDGRTGQA